MKTEPRETLRLGETDYTSERNRKILKMLAEDKRPARIAKELMISVATIRWHIEWMRNNNGYHSIAALVAAAIRKNLI
jgi:DNA-binding CsgD family transcriptional regulator